MKVTNPQKKRKRESASFASDRGDRFIPKRRNLEIARYNLMFRQQQDENQCPNITNENDYERSLEKRMFNGEIEPQILTLSQKAPRAECFDNSHLRVIYSQNRNSMGHGVVKSSRFIPQAPERVLDAPNLVDDFYLNLLDWSNRGYVAIALSQSVYCWNPVGGVVTKLLDLSRESQHNYVSSVRWIEDGSFLAVGTFNKEVMIYDASKPEHRIRTMTGHDNRVGSLCWNQHILTSGGRDGLILNHDVRVKNHIQTRIQGHSQEVCGLEWSPDGTQLASGGNDNILNIWDQGKTKPKFTFTNHTAAVKALAWCPWQPHTLASGGGTSCKRMMFWNTKRGSLINSINTESQVCSLRWSKTDRELVSGHGFSQNQLSVWKFPSLAKVAELTGHTQRILHLGQSPDGSTICSLAADETLRFWKIFSEPDNKKRFDKHSLSIQNMKIR